MVHRPGDADARTGDDLDVLRVREQLEWRLVQWEAVMRVA